MEFTFGSKSENLQDHVLAGEVHDDPGHAHDAVFRRLTEEGPNYRNVGWLGTAGLMMKTQLGLGILSIPSVFDTLGMIPGLICLCVVAAITTWSDYIVGVFKLRHREIYGIDDACGLMFGRVGQEIFGFAFGLYWTFVCGSAMLSVSIGLNAVSSHGTCTATFMAIAAITGFIFASIRTLGRISWLAWLGLVCIISSVIIVTIAVGVQDRPVAVPEDVVWVSDYKLFNTPSFTEAMSAISALIFAYAGTPAFFSLAAEMRDPNYYTRSLILCQTVITACYIAIGCVVYYFCGSYVTSPALGSAGVLIKKISYGIALPGLIVTTMLTCHLASKHVFVRILRGSKHLAANTLIHWSSWLGCTLGITIIAYLIASGIPIFGGLVSLIGALLATSLSFQPMGCMWLYDNWTSGKADRSFGWLFGVSWSIFIIVLGTFLTIAGTYASVVSIIDSYRISGGSAAWSCADNSGSV
ncbi:transmembrane amino acid transporter protein-domain-containing protein [Dactylonectria macrodidyma]|uniref:Transmembrane amino acid transporter protein-domain-containing protein n=1 Tax=Dactylonectria macrodidyma TaxID=307937 RepID=A0A9P9IQ46_9HYPO|nr:transmembrane amino acid transporter protein-domain-containing protein [Dactylonectria macrodidyma]